LGDALFVGVDFRSRLPPISLEFSTRDFSFSLRVGGNRAQALILPPPPDRAVSPCLCCARTQVSRSRFPARDSSVRAPGQALLFAAEFSLACSQPACGFSLCRPPVPRQEPHGAGHRATLGRSPAARLSVSGPIRSRGNQRCLAGFRASHFPAHDSVQIELKQRCLLRFCRRSFFLPAGAFCLFGSSRRCLMLHDFCS
jgi:hypothetical protein